MTKIIGNPTVTPMAVPDWNQTNPLRADFIKNKPKVIKEINESEIDNLHFNHPDFVEDGIYLVTDDAVSTEDGRNQYFLITATTTDRPYNKERNAIYMGNTYQFRFDYNGRIQKREIHPELGDGGSYVYNWTDWESIGSGGGGIVDQSYDGNSANAQSGKAVAQAIAQLVNGSPEALDTIYELAKALGDDPNFATTIMDMIGKKANESDLIDIVSGATMVGFAATAAADYNGNTIHETYATKKEVGGLVKELVFDTSKGESAWAWVNSDASKTPGIFKLVDIESSENGFIYEVGYLITTYVSAVDGYNQFWLNTYGDGDALKYRSFDGATGEVMPWYTLATSKDIADVEKKLCPTPVTEIPATLTIGTPYNFGEQTELSLIFPTTATDGDVIYITFESGATATNLTVDTTNTSDFDLIPEANTGYEIYAKYNGSIWIIKYSEYTVTEVA